jgi:formylmethanofuran dehydrogenase subunit C
VSHVQLTLRNPPAVLLEAPAVRPDAFATLSEAEIARVPVWHGREEAPLGDFFAVSGGRSEEVRVAGDLTHVTELGAGMTGGRLVIEGHGGRHTGAGMQGGHVVIEGDAGDGTAVEMRGGVVEVRGSAGARLGGAGAGSPRGMTGGVILVHGSAGDDAGDRLRRGVIAVAGSVGERAGCSMIAGTLFVGGSLGRLPGFGMKRGTILVGGALELLPTFRYACSYRPGFLPLLFRSLEARGFPVAARLRSGAFRRYGGDFAERGRGEILQWTDR